MTWRAVRNTTGRDVRIGHVDGGRIEVGGVGVVDDLWTVIRRGIATGALVPITADDPDASAAAAYARALLLEGAGPGAVVPDDERADLDARVTILESAIVDVGAGGYVHVQDAASTVWVVQHDLPFRPAGVIVVDDLGDRHVPPVSYPNLSTLRLDFTDPVRGTAYVS